MLGHVGMVSYLGHLRWCHHSRTRIFLTCPSHEDKKEVIVKSPASWKKCVGLKNSVFRACDMVQRLASH